MQTICEKCQGSGLVGQGPSPSLRQGRTEVCTDCKGTGKVNEKEPVEDDLSTRVDNAPETPKKEGIFKKIFGF